MKEKCSVRLPTWFGKSIIPNATICFYSMLRWSDLGRCVAGGSVVLVVSPLILVMVDQVLS